MVIERVTAYEKIVLVTGDRNWDDIATVVNVFESLHRTYGPDMVVVHGWADGLDTMGDVVCQELRVRTIRCPSHWRHVREGHPIRSESDRKWVSVHGYCPDDCREVVGRAAGVIRNRWMFDTYHPFVVHGIHNDITSSKGTKDMLAYAQKKKVRTFLHTSSQYWIYSPQLKKSSSNADAYFVW